MNRRGMNIVASDDRAISRRTSMASRVSRLFSRTGPDNHVIQPSQRTTGAFEVPIFMSPSSVRVHDPRFTEAGHTRGMFDEEHDHRVRPQDYAPSSIYSPAPINNEQSHFPEEPEYHAAPNNHEQSHFSEDSEDLTGSLHDLEQGVPQSSYASSETNLVRVKRRRRRRVSESNRQKIAGKKRLAVAFGVCALATLVTFIALAVSKAASGLMFLILSILFILILLGGFLHSLIRMLMLQRRRKARMARHDQWHGSRSRSGSSTTSSTSTGCTRDSLDRESVEKPIAVSEGPDEVVTTTPRGKNEKVVRQPPPVYGNFRSSKRLNPELLFWHKQNPSPSTPTYEEALKDVQTAVDFQPPTYASPKRERLEPGARVSNVHPLERERLAGLMGNTMTPAHM